MNQNRRLNKFELWFKRSSKEFKYTVNGVLAVGTFYMWGWILFTLVEGLAQ